MYRSTIERVPIKILLIVENEFYALIRTYWSTLNGYFWRRY